MVSRLGMTNLDWKCGATLVVLYAAVLTTYGCAPLAMSSVRQKITAGQYAAAHSELETLASRTDLSPAQRTEVLDDLCTSEFMIGAPTYSLAHQRRTCATAAAEPDSTSAQIVAQIDDRLRTAAAAQVETALKAGDLSNAEIAAERYADIPGDDQRMLEKWSAEMWILADHEITERVSGSKQHVSSAVRSLRGQYHEVIAMSPAKFEAWAAHTSSPAGDSPLVKRNSLNGSTLDLWIAENELPAAALHLDEFAVINSALAARCRCSARTHISDARTDLPAYLVYLDADVGQSDVFILPGADGLQPIADAE
jgi:hypothetical protein